MLNTLINFATTHFDYENFEDHIIEVDLYDGSKQKFYFDTQDSRRVIPLVTKNGEFYISADCQLMKISNVVVEFDYETLEAFVDVNFGDKTNHPIHKALDNSSFAKMYQHTLIPVESGEVDMNDMLECFMLKVNKQAEYHEEEIKTLKKSYGFLKSLKSYIK